MGILTTKQIFVSKPWNTNDITEGVTQGEAMQSEDIRELGYICLSETHQSPAMWGYYANRSKGACLVFDVNIEEYQELSNCLYFGKVTYTEERAIAHDKAEVRLFKKAIDWKHEQEFRILFKLMSLSHKKEEKHGTTEIIFYDTHLYKYLSGVILGTHCPRQCAEIQTYLPQKASVARMQLDSNNFSFAPHKEIPFIPHHCKSSKKLPNPPSL